MADGRKQRWPMARNERWPTAGNKDGRRQEIKMDGRYRAIKITKITQFLLQHVLFACLAVLSLSSSSSLGC